MTYFANIRISHLDMPYSTKKSELSLSFYIVILLSCFCLLLSYWQLYRYKEKKNYLKIISISENKAPLSKLPLMLNNNYDGRSFSLSVKPLINKLFLRDNVYYNGKKGYNAYMPVEFENLWYIANFGFVTEKKIPNNLDYNKLRGKVYCPKGKEFILKNIPANKGFPKTIQRFDVLEIEKAVNRKLSPCVLEVYSKNILQIKKRKILSPARHIGYCIQWLLFACLIPYIYYKSSKGSKNEKT